MALNSDVCNDDVIYVYIFSQVTLKVKLYKVYNQERIKLDNDIKSVYRISVNLNEVRLYVLREGAGEERCELLKDFMNYAK